MMKKYKILIYVLCFAFVFGEIHTYSYADEEDETTEDVAEIIVEEEKDEKDETPEEYVVIKEKRKTPEAKLHLENMSLTNVPAGARYSVDGGSSFIESSGGTESLVSVENRIVKGGTIQIYLPGNSSDTEDSDKQIIPISKANCPGGFQIKNVTTKGGNDGAISGLQGRHLQISYNSGTTYVDVNGDTINGLDADPYYIRVGSYDNVLASEPTVITIIEEIPTPVKKETTPTAIFDTRTMTLSQIPQNGKYSIDGGNQWKSASGSVELKELQPSSVILIKAVGDGVQSMDSENQMITLTKNAPPSGISPIPASSDTGLGGLDHVNSNMEYRMQGTDGFHGIGGNQVKGLVPGIYEIRIIASGTKFTSDCIEITVPVTTSKIKESTPSAVFDASTMILSNLSKGMRYSFDNWNHETVITDAFCNKVKISMDEALSALSHNGIQIQMIGNGSTTEDSKIQVIILKKEEPPKDLSTKSTSNDAGEIYHVNSSMEYAKENDNWNRISGDTVRGLKAGNYYVRVRADGNRLASESTKVTVGKKKKAVKLATPNVKFNADNMTLYNIKGVKYSLDGGNNWKIINDKDYVTLNEKELTVEKGIKLYRNGNGKEYLDSDAQIIKLKRAVAPTTLSVTNVTATSLGVIQGVSTDMEYMVGTGNSWVRISGNSLTNLQPGNYLIRMKGNGNVLPSEAALVMVGVNQEAGGAKNSAQNTSSNTTSNTTSNTVSNTASNQKNEAKESGSKKQVEETKEKEKLNEKEETKEKENSTQESMQSEKEETKDDGLSETPSVLVTNQTTKEWDYIVDTMQKEMPVFVELKQDTVIPGTVLTAARELKSDIVLEMDQDIQWCIQADSIEESVGDVDLGIKEDESVPEGYVKKASKLGEITKTFTLVHEGNFGFTANLTIPIKEGTSSQFANLIYINKEGMQLELIDSCNIDDSGYVTFQMQHASSYLVVISDKPVTLCAENNIKEEIGTVQNENQKDSFVTIEILLIVIGIFLFLQTIILSLALFRKGKKEKKQKKGRKKPSDR